jgi:hypothetical protein
MDKTTKTPPASPPATGDRCNAAPRHGSARCDKSSDHDDKHSAPLLIGGRLTWDSK